MPARIAAINNATIKGSTARHTSVGSSQTELPEPSKGPLSTPTSSVPLSGIAFSEVSV